LFKKKKKIIGLKKHLISKERMEIKIKSLWAWLENKRSGCAWKGTYLARNARWIGNRIKCRESWKRWSRGIQGRSKWKGNQQRWRIWLSRDSSWSLIWPRTRSVLRSWPLQNRVWWIPILTYASRGYCWRTQKLRLRVPPIIQNYPTRLNCPLFSVSFSLCFCLDYE